MNNIDLNNTYWDDVIGFVSEILDGGGVDRRWILREIGTNKPLGSLRIVSHPDCPPGQLRSFFTYVTSIRKKTKEEKMQTTEDYQVDLMELEVFSISDDIKTESLKHEAPFREFENWFGVKIF
jgi:hypothetical protein